MNMTGVEAHRFVLTMRMLGIEALEKRCRLGHEVGGHPTSGSTRGSESLKVCRVDDEDEERAVGESLMPKWAYCTE